MAVSARSPKGPWGERADNAAYEKSARSYLLAAALLSRTALNSEPGFH